MPLFSKSITINSFFSGPIKVSFFFGAPRMEIGGLLQSGSIIRQIWQKAVWQFQQGQSLLARTDPAGVLILGLGAGTSAELFAKTWPQAEIIGVEIDPQIIKIGRKYFKLKELETKKRLKIIPADAFKTIEKLLKEKQKFDLIAVDLYQGNKMVQKAWEDPFLINLKDITAKNGAIVFNHIFWDEHKKEAELFIKKAEKYFTKVKLSRVLANLLVITKN